MTPRTDQKKRLMIVAETFPNGAGHVCVKFGSDHVTHVTYGEGGYVPLSCRTGRPSLKAALRDGISKKIERERAHLATLQNELSALDRGDYESEIYAAALAMSQMHENKPETPPMKEPQ